MFAHVSRETPGCDTVSHLTMRRVCNHTGVFENNTPPDKKPEGRRSFQSTKSGAAEQSPLQDCMAEAPVRGLFLFTDTGITVGGHRRLLANRAVVA